VLVATTVIEVGVDVPNATVMVILDADRFGIAQLHQLRGRVGRGEHASTCWLVGAGVDPDGEARLEALVRTTDGFELAEVDLDLRGEGTMMGERQKGRNDLKLASLRRDREWVAAAREVAFELVDAASLWYPPRGLDDGGVDGTGGEPAGASDGAGEGDGGSGVAEGHDAEEAEGGAADGAPPPSALERFEAMLVELVADRRGEVMAFLGSVIVAHPVPPHWYLSAVGTRPDRQGAGGGAATLRPVLARCDREGLPAYLESSNPKNLAFYHRLGFVDRGETTTPDGAATLTFMWRDPA
jgi:GNAT superfamily N-acetyltransferase